MFDLWQLLGPHVRGLDGGAFERRLRVPGGPSYSSAAWRRWASNNPKPQPQQAGGWEHVSNQKPAGARPYGQAERFILERACMAGPVDKAVGGEGEGDGSVAAVDIWLLSFHQRMDLASSWMRGLRGQ